jgi:hypothetical protein
MAIAKVIWTGIKGLGPEESVNGHFFFRKKLKYKLIY